MNLTGSKDLLISPETGGRVPPQAVEVEESVLGAMMIETEAAAIAIHLLKPEDFYKPANRHVFETMKDLFDKNIRLDLLSIENHLRDRSLLDVVGGTGFLADLTRSVSSAATIDYHSTIIKEKSMKRQTIQRFTGLVSDAYNPESDVIDVLLDGESFVYESLTGESTAKTQTMDTVVDLAIEEIKAAQGAKDGITGIPSGTPLDELTAGWQNREAYVIAARPGMGKTAFMLEVMKNAALDGHRPGVLSLEMGNTSLVKRMIYSEAGVDSQRGRRGKLNESEMTRVKEAGERLRNLGIVLDDTTHLTAPLLRLKARMMKQQHKIDLLAIDYLQLMTAEDESESRERQVANVSRTCKLLAKELNIPILELSQLSRKPEDRRGMGKRPQNGDLRESGAIEQDADGIIMLFRPEAYGIDRYENGDSTENIIELIVTKQREGPVGFRKMLFEKETGKFKKLASTSTVERVYGDEGGSDGAWWEK